jgi:hypothetical protein
MSRLRSVLMMAVMFAVVFQGYAAASMLCATGHPGGMAVMETMQAASHDHSEHQHTSPALNDSHDHSSPDIDTGHKCGTCAACHAVGLTSTPYIAAAHPLPETDLAEPFSAVATISPGVLDKPPRT